ncbi:LLM class flavin-dependent oxidoreductase [Rhodovarius crocodyli]|uniref:LLM class flavin-dependent oxidoreductase n=1 Tax=Rhodovarius crocodyli TaxID=1979269 RepID=A0A437MLV6_9PROT|nr:LLM class flavin-dependent oxidoreductase [Rhodovarius crocodyli]RVT98654.1 LLM class flavin-dependent oxidoreductase [Rhodovarius crocodyli]
MRQMKLGYYATSTGGHIAGWRHPDAYADHGANLSRVAEMARLAESACLDFLFLADSITMRGRDWDVLARSSNRYVAQFEPLTLLGALAASTSRIGMVATASTTYEEPYNLARRFASLDLLSDGRCGWNIVTSSNPNEPGNFSMDGLIPHADRYRRAAEFVEVVKGLWNTWDAGAQIRDKEAGLFFDAAGMRLLNHVGEHFQVRGPLNVPRSPQGRPVLVQAGASGPGRDLAAGVGEVIFSTIADYETARDFYRDIKRRAAEKGRDPDRVLVMPAVNIYVAPTREEARAKYDEVRELIEPVVGRAFLEMMLATSLGNAPDDGPLPELATDNTTTSGVFKVQAEARREGLTIRELYLRMADKDSFSLFGTPADIADQLQHRFEGEAADGYVFMPAFFPNCLTDFTTMVVPELRRRGLFRDAYSATTLRGHLGLD